MPDYSPCLWGPRTGVVVMPWNVERGVLVIGRAAVEHGRPVVFDVVGGAPGRRKTRGVEGRLAVGETVILMTPPLLSRLKHLLKVDGDAAEWQSRRQQRQTGRELLTGLCVHGEWML